jgi:Clp amino terminal domain, pathogenicity island component
MFERFTESARRVIFFARYEGSQFGSAYIDTEHLLLGLLREEPALTKRLIPKLDRESVREQLEARGSAREPTTTSVDLRLSNASKRVLAYAAEEAERLSDKHIGSEHLLLGLVRVEKSIAAEILQKQEVKIKDLRLQIAEYPGRYLGFSKRPLSMRPLGPRVEETVELHGSRWKVEYLREVVGRLREYSWHWQRRSWKPRDILIARADGSVSFDLGLVADTANFELIKGGWKKDHCAICRWELFEATEDPGHGFGYTNGREWLCTECHEKFFAGPDFFGSAYSEIT